MHVARFIDRYMLIDTLTDLFKKKNPPPPPPLSHTNK